MSFVNCPKGHHVDTSDIGDEGTFECDKCTIQYLQQRLAIKRGDPMTGPSKLAQQAAEKCAESLIGSDKFHRRKFAADFAPLISSVIEPLERERLGDFVNRTLKMWQDAAKLSEMAGVRFDVAEEILRNTYSVAEMEALPESELAQARQDEKEAEARYQACYAELTKVQASLASLSQERDRLQAQLDQQPVVNSFEYDRTVKALESRLSSLSEAVGTLLKSITVLINVGFPNASLQQLDDLFRAADKCRALGVGKEK